MGKKYIIELERGETAYKTVNSNGTSLIKLLASTPYTEPDMEQVRKEFFEKGYSTAVAEQECAVREAAEKGYQRGIDDANRDGEYNADDGWYVMQKISLLPNPIKTELFGTAETAVILQDNSFKDALAKLTEYEQEQEERIDPDKSKVEALANDIGIHKLFALVKEIRGE